MQSAKPSLFAIDRERRFFGVFPVRKARAASCGAGGVRGVLTSIYRGVCGLPVGGVAAHAGEKPCAG